MFSAPELSMFVYEQAWFASPVCLSSNRLESLSCAVIDFSPHSIKFSISCGLHVLWSKNPIDAPADVSPPQLTPSTMHTPRDHLRGHIRWQRRERASFEQPLQTMPTTVERRHCAHTEAEEIDLAAISRCMIFDVRFAVGEVIRFQSITFCHGLIKDNSSIHSKEQVPNHKTQIL